MEKLFTLLELQRKAQEAATREALLHVIVNHTQQLIPYKQAVFWDYSDKPVPEKVSGNAVLDRDSPFALELYTKIASALKDVPSGQTVIVVSSDDKLRHPLLAVFRTKEDGVLGGLWLENTERYHESSVHILEELSVSYAYSLALQKLRQRTSLYKGISGLSRLKKYAFVLILVMAFFPVRLSATAPVEIVARNSMAVTIPYDGTIETVVINPGDPVKKDQVLVTMEDTALSAQMEMAEQQLQATQASLARLRRESLSSPERKSDLTAYEEEIRSKKIEYDFAKDLSQKSEIRAEKDGIAVFADSQSLKGKPVTVGDKIMEIADPADFKVLIRIPVEAMIPLTDKNSVSFYLNVSPLSSYDAKISSIGYQASPDPDGLLTYKIYANPQVSDQLRIGWKGIARIRGDWTVLSYAILRRPIVALRHLIGI